MKTDATSAPAAATVTGSGTASGEMATAPAISRMPARHRRARRLAHSTIRSQVAGQAASVLQNHSTLPILAIALSWSYNFQSNRNC